MLLHTYTILLGYIAVAFSREALRPVPTITNSLVNLGKMEIALYFSDSPSHNKKPEHGRFPPHFFPKLETVIEDSCPCSHAHNIRDSFLPNPVGLFNKILSSNDLFSSNNDPLHSSLCCGSHEQVAQEGSVFLELAPNQKSVLPIPLRTKSPPMLPFIFDSMIPSKSMLPSKTKGKAIEIFMFPKKKSLTSNFDMSKFSKKRDKVLKKDITVVGEKKLDNNINLFNIPAPVKKDLSAQEKNVKAKENDKPAEEGDTIILESSTNNPNAV